MSVLKVLIVGTGNIAKVHAEALLANPSAKMVAVYDNNKALAEQFARQFNIPKVCADIDEAVALDFDVVHVLTPPIMYIMRRHCRFCSLVAKLLLKKLVGVSTQECAEMQAIAEAAGTLTAVNQNFMYSPAYLNLKRDIEAGKLGPVRFVDYVYEAPLKQLAARQFGHWMFCQPVNILLEQAVHPLSQIVDFVGNVEKCDAQAAQGTEISPGVVLYTQLQATLQCQQAPVNFRFHVGSKFPACRMTVYCDDGIAIADMFTNQYFQVKRTTYLDAADGFLSAAKSAGQLFATGAGNLINYALAMVKLKSRSDPFYLGMKGSIDEIYSAFTSGEIA
ncbi:MAG: Gfo/Idh/MocA family oxidoreductase [Rheinheimera sp.]|nr:Gfo/Idh/MocA family oxidoreductase [Rheinheimera sp.]